MAGGVADMVEMAKKMGIGALDNVKAGVDVAGSVAKTIGKRIVGNDTPTPLKPETKKTLGIDDKDVK
jgi:hypothetical protein